MGMVIFYELLNYCEIFLEVKRIADPTRIRYSIEKYCIEKILTPKFHDLKILITV